jgi:hypothetical protein
MVRSMLNIAARWAWAAAIVVALGASSCQKVEEVSPESLPNIPVPTNLSGFLSSDGVQLFWEFDSTYAYGGFDIFRSEDDQATWSKVATVSGPPYTDKNLRSQFTYWYRVAGVDENGLRGNSSVSWPARPAVYEVIVNDRDPYTGSRDVVLTFTAPAATQNVRFAESQDLTGVPWRVYASQYVFKLTPGDGTKTVWAQFIDDAGNLTQPVSSSITLDTFAEISNLDFVTSAAPSDTIAPGGSVTFTINTTGNEPMGECDIYVEGMGATPIKAYDDGRNGDSNADDGVYERTYTFALSFRQRSMRMSAEFTDAAGNVSVEREFDRNMYMSDPPDAVTLNTITMVDTTSITLNWTRSADDHFAAYKVYRRTQSPVDPIESILAGSVSDQATTVFTDSGLPRSTTFYYAVFVVNDLDEGTKSNEQSGTTQ